MDGSSELPKTTAGLDIGDKYSYLCLIDTVSGEVIEEGRLRTILEAFERPIPNHLTEFCGGEPLLAAVMFRSHRAISWCWGLSNTVLYI
jgi:hypothetical protein